MSRSARPPAPSGLIVVDKPGGITSHDVVSRVRRMAGTRRVGHGGTLDPMATGVLVVGVERATRLLTYVVGSDKGYAATIRLGQSTVTDDAEGEVIATVAATSVTEEGVRRALSAFVGELDQVPSAVSAIKVGGVRSYARVRQGEEVALAARRVTISRLDVLAVRPLDGGDPGAGGALVDLVDVDISLICSSGTYVRAIARDLGAALGVGGHLTALRRTSVGGFTLAEAVPLDVLAARTESGASPVTLPLAAACERIFTRREVEDEQARALGHGVPLPVAGIGGPYAVYDPSGAVIAIVSERDGRARAEVVLAPSGGH